MCNDYGLNHPITRLNQAFRVLQYPIIFPTGQPNLESREDIRPTDPAPIVRRVEGGAEFVSLRWGFPPARPKAGPVINFRSEGRSFDRGRCLVPASHFFEFTGAKAPKSKWKFTRPDGAPFCMAGFWREGSGDESAAFTLLTIAPGPDVAPYHDRQIVPVPDDRWADWLDPSVPAASLLVAEPAGSMAVEQVR